jgi:hypothetical protein
VPAADGGSCARLRSMLGRGQARRRTAFAIGLGENRGMATPTKLSDAQAKVLLRGWPSHRGDVVRSDAWPTPHGKGAWLRAQPPETASKPGPRPRSPGAKLFSTQPDGLWVWFGPEAQFADVLVIEVCGTAQNLNDKRSRYGPTTMSLLLITPRRWLLSEVSGTRSLSTGSERCSPRPQVTQTARGRRPPCGR